MWLLISAPSALPHFPTSNLITTQAFNAFNMNLSKIASTLSGSIAESLFARRSHPLLSQIASGSFSSSAAQTEHVESSGPQSSIEQVTTNENAELDKLYKTVEMELKGNDPAVLNSYAKFATMAAQNFDIPVKSWNLRKPKKERFTMYKSVHIYKRHKAQYELRTYFTFVQFKHLTGSTCDTLLEYLQRNLPEGVALKTSKVELQKFPDHLEIK